MSDPALRPDNPTSLTEDAQWIATILSPGSAASRQEGFRQLLVKYWKLVVVLAQNQVGDRRQAEDIAQEAFVRAFQSLRNLSEPVAFLGWLLRIARNLATDHLRGRKPMISLDVLGESAAWRSPGKREADGGIAQALEAEEEMEQVVQAMAELPEKYREVVALRYLQGLDGKTMARLLGEPEGTIRNRLFRAIHKLRQTLLERGHRS